MSAALLAALTLIAVGGPAGIAVLAAARRGGSAVEVIADGLLGIGAFLVAMWYAAGIATISPTTLAVAGLAGGAVAALGLGPRTGRVTFDRSAAAVLATAVVLGVLCLVPFLPHGVERPDGVHRFSMTDWEKHLMFTTEMVSFDEIPPRNPYLRSAGEAPYYAGFQLLASVIARASGGTAAALPALLALTLLTVFLLPAVTWALARQLSLSRRTATVAAVGAALLGGFDLIPLAIDAARAWSESTGSPASLSGLRDIVPSVNPDYWLHHNERQFDPPYRNAIWAPQHLLGALMGLTALLQLWRAERQALPLRTAVTTGVALVATAMLSAYTAIALGVGLVAIALSDALAVRSGAGRWLSTYGWLTGLTAVIVGLPFAAQLAASPSAGLTVALSSAGTWRNGAVLTSAFGDTMATRLLDTPAILIVELGAIGILGTLGLRRAEPGHGRRIVAFSLAVLALVVFVRPPLGGPNNLYPRGVTLVWILLAPFAAAALPRLGRRTAALLLVPCALYVPYATVGATLEGYLFWATPLADHEAARWVQERTAEASVVALEPDEGPVYFTYWARRPIVFDDERLARLFGATAAQVDDVRTALAEAFDTVVPRSAATAFAQLGADQVVVATDSAQARAWATSSCFVTGYRSERWMVLSPLPESCER